MCIRSIVGLRASHSSRVALAVLALRHFQTACRLIVDAAVIRMLLWWLYCLGTVAGAQACDNAARQVLMRAVMWIEPAVAILQHKKRGYLQQPEQVGQLPVASRGSGMQ